MSSSNEKSGSHSLLPWKHTAFKDFLKLAMSVAMEIGRPRSSAHVSLSISSLIIANSFVAAEVKLIWLGMK